MIEASEGEGKNGENNGCLRDDNAGTGSVERINNRPGLTDPGNLCEDETAGESNEGEIMVVTLDNDMASCAVADNEADENWEDCLGVGEY